MKAFPGIFAGSLVATLSLPGESENEANVENCKEVGVHDPASPGLFSYKTQ